MTSLVQVKLIGVRATRVTGEWLCDDVLDRYFTTIVVCPQRVNPPNYHLNGADRINFTLDAATFKARNQSDNRRPNPFHKRPQPTA